MYLLPYDLVQIYIVVNHLYQTYLPSLLEVWEYYRGSVFLKIIPYFPNSSMNL